MPLNVCDKNGRHIGFLYSTEIFGAETDVVALSTKKIRQLHCESEKLLQNAAMLLDAKTILGKINEAKLNERLREFWQEKKATLGDFDRDFIIKSVCLNKSYLKLSDYYIVSSGDIKGFLLFDKSQVEFFDKETVIIKEDLEYVLDAPLIADKLPIYAKIIDYPILKTVEAFVGAHGITRIPYTTLNIKSGNLQKVITLAAGLNAKMGMAIQLYLSDKKGITGAFCDGVIYEF